MKVTFKKHARITGLAGIGYSHPNVDIKINKKIIGEIVGPTWQTPDGKWGIMFCVMKKEPDDNPNCEWKNIILKARLNNEQDARKFVEEYINQISDRYTFHYRED